MEFNCGGDGAGDDEPSSWENTKANTSLELFFASEFDMPERLSIATMGWEDGLNISRNGLHIYATYLPTDFFRLC